jgi:hypothetical protein
MPAWAHCCAEYTRHARRFTLLCGINTSCPQIHIAVWNKHVMPAEAGIQRLKSLDPCFRRDDKIIPYSSEILHKNLSYCMVVDVILTSLKKQGQ